jgi:hypothetical protein
MAATHGSYEATNGMSDCSAPKRSRRNFHRRPYQIRVYVVDIRPEPAALRLDRQDRDDVDVSSAIAMDVAQS